MSIRLLLRRVVETVDLLLLDVSMADMDGFAFRDMQLDAPTVADIPTIVVTGHVLESNELARLHATTVVTKPISVTALREMVAIHAGVAKHLWVESRSA